MPLWPFSKKKAEDNNYDYDDSYDDDFEEDIVDEDLNTTSNTVGAAALGTATMLPQAAAIIMAVMRRRSQPILPRIPPLLPQPLVPSWGTNTTKPRTLSTTLLTVTPAPSMATR